MTSRDEMLAQIRHEDESLTQQLHALPSDTAEDEVRGKIEHLRTRHNSLQERIAHVNTHSAEAWDDVKHEAQKIWIDLREIAEVVTQVFH